MKIQINYKIQIMKFLYKILKNLINHKFKGFNQKIKMLGISYLILYLIKN